MSIDQSAIVFRRKISSFCEMKLAQLTDARQFRALSKYMTGLIDDRMPPPMLGRHFNWEEISLASGLEQASTELRRIAQCGFDAISRWLVDTPEMVQQHYGRFLPQDKAALAVKILNQVWEAA